MTGYLNSIISDRENPLARIILENSDIKISILTGLLHDIGQISFGHDLENSCPSLYNHVDTVEKLIIDPFWGTTLKKIIEDDWGIDTDRILKILKKEESEDPVDYLIRDIIDGPIDADKFDYLYRDSIACGVPAGKGIDRKKFLLSLSTTTIEKKGKDNKVNGNVRLAYKSRGESAINSLLWARFQMYNCVYWHHTFRCLQAMFSSAVYNVFSEMKREVLFTDSAGGEHSISIEKIKKIFIDWVICGKPIAWMAEKHGITQEIFTIGPKYSKERVISLIWNLSDNATKEMLDNLLNRNLFKRMYILKIQNIENKNAFNIIKEKLTIKRRNELSKELERMLVQFIDNLIKTHNRGEFTSTTKQINSNYQTIKESSKRMILIDFTSNGIPPGDNLPYEIVDSRRRYYPFFNENEINKISNYIKTIHEQSARITVFVHPELHRVIQRYDSSRGCLEITHNLLKKEWEE